MRRARVNPVEERTADIGTGTGRRREDKAEIGERSADVAGPGLRREKREEVGDKSADVTE